MSVIMDIFDLSLDEIKPSFDFSKYDIHLQMILTIHLKFLNLTKIAKFVFNGQK